MSMVKKIDADPRVWDRLFANVGQLSMITTVDSQGRVNAATFATGVRTVHEPVHISFTTSVHKDTWHNIKETGQFTFNVPSFDRDLLEKATVLGLTFDRGVNELEKAGLTAIPAVKVKPPRIAECRRHFECEVVWTKEWVGRVTITGICVAASVDEDCVDERGFVKFDRVKPAVFCGAPYLRYHGGPPYRYMFAGAYEIMTVDIPYKGPEIESHDKMVTDEKFFR
jgi:flavin reductase (DIM6/NTAB) family NADH-FMN oxidoreductase RutF